MPIQVKILGVKNFERKFRSLMLTPDILRNYTASFFLGDHPKVPKPFRPAWKRGFADFMKKRTAALNPYPDRRTGYKSGATFSRAWRRYWEEGREAAESAERGFPFGWKKP